MPQQTPIDDTLQDFAHTGKEADGSVRSWTGLDLALLQDGHDVGFFPEAWHSAFFPALVEDP